MTSGINWSNYSSEQIMQMYKANPNSVPKDVYQSVVADLGQDWGFESQDVSEWHVNDAESFEAEGSSKKEKLKSWEKKTTEMAKIADAKAQEMNTINQGIGALQNAINEASTAQMEQAAAREAEIEALIASGEDPSKLNKLIKENASKAKKSANGISQLSNGLGNQVSNAKNAMDAYLDSKDFSEAAREYAGSIARGQKGTNGWEVAAGLALGGVGHVLTSGILSLGEKGADNLKGSEDYSSGRAARLNHKDNVLGIKMRLADNTAKYIKEAEGYMAAAQQTLGSVNDAAKSATNAKDTLAKDAAYYTDMLPEESTSGENNDKPRWSWQQ